MNSDSVLRFPLANLIMAQRAFRRFDSCMSHYIQYKLTEGETMFLYEVYEKGSNGSYFYIGLVSGETYEEAREQASERFGLENCEFSMSQR